MTDLPEELEKYVESLGRSPRRIRNKLKKKGVVGLVDDSKMCPLAQALIREFPRAWHLDVLVTFVRFMDADYKTWHTVHLPRATTEFIKKFDAREYPELIACKE